MATVSQVASAAFNIVKVLTARRNNQHQLALDSPELPPDAHGNPNWMTFCPAHEDISTPSLHVSYHDRVLVKCRAGCSQDKVVTALRALNVWPENRSTNYIINNPAHEDIDYEQVYRTAVLDDLGRLPDVIYTYTDAGGNPVFWVLRNNTIPKIIKPLVSITYKDNSESRFVQMHMPNNRPPYNMLRVARAQTIVIVEGEKTVEAAQTRWPDRVFSTWSGGTGAVKQTDWSLLKGKNVILVPDNDQPGIDAMEQIAGLLFALDTSIKMSFAFRKIQEDLPKGWDLADAAEGDSTGDLVLQNAKQVDLDQVSKPLADLATQIDQLNTKYVPLMNGGRITAIDITQPGVGQDGRIPYFNFCVNDPVAIAIVPDKVLLPGDRKPTYVIRAWAEQFIQKLVSVGLMYDPGTAERTVYHNSQRFFNTFRGFHYEPVKGDGHWFFVEHIRWLLGFVAAEYTLDWLAHLIQKPHEKPGTIIIVKGDQGTGKSFIGKMVCELVGHDNSVTITPKRFASNFNDYLFGRLFVNIDEFYQVNSMTEKVAEEFRSLITEGEVQLEKKHVSAIQMRSFHRFYGSTNNVQPIKLEFNSRRENIFQSAKLTELQDVAYFDRLNDLLFDKEAMSHMMFFLKDRKITHNVRMAMKDTEGREELYSPADPIVRFLHDILYDAEMPADFKIIFVGGGIQPLVYDWLEHEIRLPRWLVNEYLRKHYKVDASAMSISRRLEKQLDCPEIAPTPGNPRFKTRYEYLDQRDNRRSGNDACYMFPRVGRLRELFETRNRVKVNWPRLAEVEPKVAVNNVIPF